MDELNRNTYIGGGDAAAIMGCNPYRSILEVYLNKTMNLESQDISDQLPVQVGCALESLIIDRFEKDNDVTVLDRQGCPVNADYPFIAGHIDGAFIDKNGKYVLLEIKTTSAFLSKEWDENTNDLPIHYLYQVYHYFACEPRFDYAVVSCLIGNSKIKNIIIERDQEIVDALIEREKEFWQMVQDKTPPQVTRATDINVMKRLYNDPVDNAIDITSVKTTDIAQELLSVQSTIKELEIKEDILKANLQAEIKENTEARAGKYYITWKAQSTTKLDTKALQSAEPDIAKKYMKTTISRVFRIKELKDGNSR